MIVTHVHCSKENKGCEVDTYLQDLISFGSPLKTLFCCLILVLLLLHIYVDYWFGVQTSLGTSHSWHSEPQLGFIRKIAFSLPLPLIPLQKNNTEIKIKKNVTQNLRNYSIDLVLKFYHRENTLSIRQNLARGKRKIDNISVSTVKYLNKTVYLDKSHSNVISISTHFSCKFTQVNS